MNLYFIYESGDTLKSFGLFLFVKTTAKLNKEHSANFEIRGGYNFEINVVVHVL